MIHLQMRSKFQRLLTLVAVAGPLTLACGCALPSSWGRRAAQQSAENLEAQLSVARLSERHGQPETAEKIYLAILSKNPESVGAQHRLGVIAAGQGRFSEAEERFQRAIQLDPENVGLRADYGYCLYLQDRLPEAEQILREVIQRQPQCQVAHNNLALVLGEQGRFEESLDEFRKVVSEAEAYANLGYVQAQQGLGQEAEQSLHRSLALNQQLRPAAEALLKLSSLQGKAVPPAPHTESNFVARQAIATQEAQAGTSLSEQVQPVQALEVGEAEINPADDFDQVRTPAIATVPDATPVAPRSSFSRTESKPLVPPVPKRVVSQSSIPADEQAPQIADWYQIFQRAYRSDDTAGAADH